MMIIQLNEANLKPKVKIKHSVKLPTNGSSLSKVNVFARICNCVLYNDDDTFYLQTYDCRF